MNNSIPMPTARTMLNKVPEVTAAFWIIKVLATTVGETFADFLNVSLGFGLTVTSIVMGALLIGALIAQFVVRRYLPAVYWLAVVLISVVGTLITDNLTDNFGVPLFVTAVIFAIALAATFIAWFASERTLSIHSIVTTRRETFYWLTVLFTFALGTAAGDLLAESLNLGYAAVARGVRCRDRGRRPAATVFANLNAVAAFWIAYVLTRPLGASTGDLLSQATKDGGLGLGTTATSVIFLARDPGAGDRAVHPPAPSAPRPRGRDRERRAARRRSRRRHPGGPVRPRLLRAVAPRWTHASTRPSVEPCPFPVRSCRPSGSPITWAARTSWCSTPRCCRSRAAATSRATRSTSCTAMCRARIRPT